MPKKLKKVKEEPKEPTLPESPEKTPEEIREQNLSEVKTAEERHNKLLGISAELNLEGVGTSPELSREIEKAKLNLEDRKRLAK